MGWRTVHTISWSRAEGFGVPFPCVHDGECFQLASQHGLCWGMLPTGRSSGWGRIALATWSFLWGKRCRLPLVCGWWLRSPRDKECLLFRCSSVSASTSWLLQTGNNLVSLLVLCPGGNHDRHDSFLTGESPESSQEAEEGAGEGREIGSWHWRRQNFLEGRRCLGPHLCSLTINEFKAIYKFLFRDEGWGQTCCKYTWIFGTKHYDKLYNVDGGESLCSSFVPEGSDTSAGRHRAKRKKKSSLNFKTRSANAGRHECPRHSLQVEPYSSLVLAL